VSTVLLLPFVVLVCYVIKMLIKQERNLAEEFKASCEKDAERSQPMKEEGNRNFQEGDYRNALFQYTLALRSDSFNPLLYGNRALCYLKMGEYKAALADGKRCIVIKPEWDKGQHRYAQALFELGHYREAREANDKARKQCSISKILDEQKTVFEEKMTGELRRFQPADRSKPTWTTNKGTSNQDSSTEEDPRESYKTGLKTTWLTQDDLEEYKDHFSNPGPGMSYIRPGSRGSPKEPLSTKSSSKKETDEFPDDLPELVSSDDSTTEEDTTDEIGDSIPGDGDKKKSDMEDKNDAESDDSMPELVESSGFEEDDEDNGHSSDSALPGLVSDENELSSDSMPLRIQRRTKQPKELDHDTEEAKREARRMENETKRRRIEENVRKARKKIEREQKKQEEAKRMREVTRAEQKRRAQAEELVLVPPSHLASTKWEDEKYLLEDLSKKNSKWDNMREKLLRATRELLDGRSKQASLLFKDAIGRVTTERADYRESFSDTDHAVLYYAVGMSLLKSGGHTDIQDAVVNFEKIIKTWKKLQFPLAYYGLGKSFTKQNRFTEALEPLNKGLEIVNSKSDWQPLSWPGAPTIIIDESEPDRLPLCFNELVIFCTHPPKPDAIDKFPDHTGKREIYFTDPDFKGFVRVVCSDGCRLEYFPANWKKIKANYMNRSTEKVFIFGL
jgi:tetratricopeptide (TPR) repeat protein